MRVETSLHTHKYIIPTGAQHGTSQYASNSDVLSGILFTLPMLQEKKSIETSWVVGNHNALSMEV